MSADAPRPTRTENICRAVLEELRRRRTVLDDNGNLSSVTLTVYFNDGSDVIRSISVEETTRRAGRRA